MKLFLLLKCSLSICPGDFIIQSLLSRNEVRKECWFTASVKYHMEISSVEEKIWFCVWNWVLAFVSVV